MQLFNQREGEIVFETFTLFPFFAFRTMLFTIEQLRGDESFFERVKHLGRVNYYRFCLIILPPSAIMIWGYAAVNASDIIEALSAVPNGMFVTLVSSKGIVTFLKRKQIWKVFLELKQIFEDHPNESVKSKVKEHLDTYQRKIKVYAGTFIMTWLPIAFPVVPYLINGTMSVTVDYWFPFDPYTRRWFPFVLFWGDWISWNSLATLLASDSLLFALVTLVAMEFDILKSDFQVAISSFQITNDTTKSLIDRHNKLLDICDSLSDIYSPTFLSAFVITSFNLCLVAFQLSTGQTDIDVISFYAFFVPYLAMLSGHAYLICDFGQNIIDATASIAEGIYESDWQDIKDESFKRQLLLTMQRSQKVNKLTAMGFAEVSISSFTNVSSSEKFSFF